MASWMDTIQPWVGCQDLTTHTVASTVGMPVTRHPLHRSGREALPHPAPTLGLTANVLWATEGDLTTTLPYTRQRLGHARPALLPVRVTCRMFPLVTALPSTRSAAHRGALFAGFFGTMLVSDCSGPLRTTQLSRGQS